MTGFVQCVFFPQDDEIIDLDLDESDDVEAVVIDDDENDNDESSTDLSSKVADDTTISLIDLTDDSQDSDIGLVSSSTEVRLWVLLE